SCSIAQTLGCLLSYGVTDYNAIHDAASLLVQALMQLAYTFGQLSNGAVDDKSRDDIVNRIHRNRRWRHAPCAQPLTQLRRRTGEHNPPQTRPAMRGRAHRTMLAGGVDAGVSALLRAQVSRRPLGQLEFWVASYVLGHGVILRLAQYPAVGGDQQRTKGLVPRLQRPFR